MTILRYLRLLLLPFSLLYGVAVSLRNALYRSTFFKPVSFDIPVISVGNLSTGGTGKTPHLMYLLDLLREYLDLAVLSRGYGRRTEGFRMVEVRSSAPEVGDEPLLIKRRYPDIPVAVAEDRALAIPRILSQHPTTQVILLDDAFQHRAVRPGLSILLTTWDRPFSRDFLLPAGNLREWREAYKRADILVVTKCPPGLDAEAEAARWKNELKLLPFQRLYFSAYRYGRPYYLYNPAYVLPDNHDVSLLFVTGIADNDYLEKSFQPQRQVAFLRYPDHHRYTREDMLDIKLKFDSLEGGQKVILTTEKDAIRLDEFRQFILDNRLPVYAVPIRVEILYGQGKGLEEDIRQYLLNFKA